MNWLEQLEKWLGGGPGEKKRIRSFRWLLWLGLVGVVLMMLQSFVSVEPPIEPTGRASLPDHESTTSLVQEAEDNPFADYERRLEERMQEILERIVGVNGVEVMVTVESTEEQVVFQNERDTQQITEEHDRNGGRRHVTEVMKSGEIVLHENESGQVPVVVTTLRPKVSGVIVVAGGTENETVRKLIVDAVQKGLNVPPHRISVLPGKQRR